MNWYKEWEKEEWYREKAKAIRNPRELVMGEGLRRNAVAIPHRLALVYADRRYTFKELNAKANQVANSLLALGVKKGDKIGVFASNGDYPVISALGVMKAGAVFVPISFRLMGEDVEHVLNASELDAVLDTMEAAPNKWDVSSVHMINTIGAFCLPGTRERTAKLFGENLLCPEYGSSETGLPTSLPPGEALKYPRSDGPAAWGQEVRILDDDGKEMSQGEVGEICVASSMTTYGYYKNPEASRKAFVGRFVRSGDVGYLDNNGYVYVMGRKSDMILSGGVNVYPEDIESTMIKNPKIAEVAVIGVPDKKWGEAVKALVRLAPGQEAAEEEIISWCKEKMPHYRAPKSVEFVTAFPYTPQGKIRKNVLREKYLKA